MASPKKTKLMRLMNQYKKYIIILIGVALFFIISSLIIYAVWTPKANSVTSVLAKFLMTIGETIIGASLIGGGIGGVVNFVFEEFKKEEEERKERLKDAQENREKQKIFRKEMQSKLQIAHDHVELARVLIKSHKSGKTYGEQIRDYIMPSLIALKDVKRGLSDVEEKRLRKNLDCLQVSLTYMIAYLSVLLAEFEMNYLKLSNLQNYQDAMANKMRTLFSEIAESKKEGDISLEKKQHFLDSAEDLFNETEVPSNIEVVWKAMEELDYLWDFIDELRNEKGVRSMYYKYFLKHYFHCNKIIKTKDSDTNKKVAGRKDFIDNIAELKRIEEKKESDQPLTNRDSLTRKIMEHELRFDFETAKMKPLGK